MDSKEKALVIMKKVLSIIMLSLAIYPVYSRNNHTRMIVTTDIGGSDPDDIQSLVHLMVMLNDVDLVGIISQHAWVPYGTGAVDVIENVIGAYEKALPNLLIHDTDYPDANTIRSMVKKGQPNAAIACVGEGKDSEGSEWIIKMVDKKDKRPIWIAAWSGMNTLAQALWKVSHTRSPKDVEKFVSKLRVYDILGQDDAGAWIAKNYPQLTYIRNKEVYGWPKDDDWYRKNVQEKGPLGKVYASRIWATEGDTPSFLYCIENGLNSPEHIDFGGWGGRFSTFKKENIESMDWVKKSHLDEMQYAPYLMHGASEEGNGAITRWAEDIHNDFKARMLWTVTNDYSRANHHPVAVIDNEKSRLIITMTARSGKEILLDAGKSYDPDGDSIVYNWQFYKEPSSYKGNLQFKGRNTPSLRLFVPDDAKGKTIHVILKVADNHTTPLFAYRRVVINVR